MYLYLIFVLLCPSFTYPMEDALTNIWPTANQVRRYFMKNEKEIYFCFLSENVFDTFYSNFVTNIPQNPSLPETITLKKTKTDILYAVDDNTGLIFVSSNLYSVSSNLYTDLDMENFCNILQAIDNNFRMYHKVAAFLTVDETAKSIINKIINILQGKDYRIILFDQDKVNRTENILSLCAQKTRKRERTLNNLTTFYIKLFLTQKYIDKAFNDINSGFDEVYTLKTALKLNASDIKTIENNYYTDDAFKYAPLELFFWFIDYFKKNQKIQKQIIEEFNTIKTSCNNKKVIIILKSEDISHEDIRKICNLTLTALYSYYQDFPTVFDQTVFDKNVSSKNYEKKSTNLIENKKNSNVNSPDNISSRTAGPHSTQNNNYFKELLKKTIFGFIFFVVSMGFFNKAQSFHLSFLQYTQLFLCHLLIYKAVLAI